MTNTTVANAIRWVESAMAAITIDWSGFFSPILEALGGAVVPIVAFLGVMFAAKFLMVVIPRYLGSAKDSGRGSGPGPSDRGYGSWRA